MYWDLFMVLPYSGYLKAAHISYAGGNGTIPGANRGIVRTDRRIAGADRTIMEDDPIKVGGEGRAGTSQKALI